MLDLENIHSVYFIGIGGIGMSATAGIASELGLRVFGSDAKTIYEPSKSILDKYDIEYTVGYSESNVRDHPADLYIASSGEDLHNPEIKYLVESGLAFHSFSEFLASISQDKLRVVVAGTHGKSTTSGMLGKVLQQIDDSSFVTGAVLQHDLTNFHLGDGHYFVFEGDEYKALFNDPTPKFHQYEADILLLTNLEFDHPDIFASLDEMKNEFSQLLASLPDDGLVVWNADSIALAQIMHPLDVGQVSYGIHSTADFMASNIQVSSSHTSFTVSWKKHTSNSSELKEVMEDYRLNIFGEINVYNALGVIALLRTLGFSYDQVQGGLDNYFGIKRRLELKGVTNGITIYDDYAHHPTAVKETLKTLKSKHPDAKVWAVFEPHTYSRTTATISELEQAFDVADHVLIANIYPAREVANPTTITTEQVVDSIAKHHPSVRQVNNRDEAEQILRSEMRSGDVVVIMAVGNFNVLADELVKK